MTDAEMVQVTSYISNNLDCILSSDTDNILDCLQSHSLELMLKGVTRAELATMMKTAVIQSYVAVATSVCVQLSLPHVVSDENIETMESKISERTLNETRTSSSAVNMLMNFIVARMMIDVSEVSDHKKEQASRKSDEFLASAIELLDSIK